EDRHEGIAQGRMIASERKHAPSAHQVEIACSLPVDEVLAVALAEPDVESHRLEDAHQLLVEVARVQGVALCFPCGEKCCDVQTHGIPVPNKRRFRSAGWHPPVSAPTAIATCGVDRLNPVERRVMRCYAQPVRARELHEIIGGWGGTAEVDRRGVGLNRRDRSFKCHVWTTYRIGAYGGANAKIV